MSVIDPECYPELHGDDRRVCAACFGDTDLQAMICAAGDMGPATSAEPGARRRWSSPTSPLTSWIGPGHSTAARSSSSL